MQEERRCWLGWSGECLLSSSSSSPLFLPSVFCLLLLPHPLSLFCLICLLSVCLISDSF